LETKLSYQKLYSKVYCVGFFGNIHVFSRVLTIRLDPLQVSSIFKTCVHCWPFGCREQKKKKHGWLKTNNMISIHECFNKCISIKSLKNKQLLQHSILYKMTSLGFQTFPNYKYSREKYNAKNKNVCRLWIYTGEYSGFLKPIKVTFEMYGSS